MSVHVPVFLVYVRCVRGEVLPVGMRGGRSQLLLRVGVVVAYIHFPPHTAAAFGFYHMHYVCGHLARWGGVRVGITAMGPVTCCEGGPCPYGAGARDLKVGDQVVYFLKCRR